MIVKVYINKDIETGDNIFLLPGSRDSAATNMFSTSLVTSLKKVFRLIGDKTRTIKDGNSAYISSLEKDIISFLTKKKSICDFRWGDKPSLIVVDIKHTVKNGRDVDFCRVSIEYGNGGIREMNILNEFARLVYSTVYFLRAINPPAGMECLKRINLIKDFIDRKDGEEKIRVVRDTRGNAIKVESIPIASP